MQRSFRAPRIQPHIQFTLIGMAMLLAVALASAVGGGRASAAAPVSGVASGWQQATTANFTIYVQSDDPQAAETFAAAYGTDLETAVQELSLVFDLNQLPGKLSIYAYSDETAFAAAVAVLPRDEIAGVSAYADTGSNDISLSFPDFIQLSATDSTNQLRHAVSHLLTGIATDGKLPWGFDEGIAQYVERPVNEKLARTAGLVQTANQRGDIASWFDINTKTPKVEPSLAAAEAYSVIAYLIDTYKLPALEQFLTEMKTAATWREAIRTAYARDPDSIETQWHESLPKWTASGWRDNIISGFDLEPARKLLAQANYAAALAALEPSLLLYAQLGEPASLQDAKTMANQCDIGTTAETLMQQTQQALETHAYDRAANLIAQAKLQYEQLPTEQQPVELLTSYDTLANQGITAGTDLDHAVQLSHNWRDYPDARTAARSAGTSYARLGDTDGAAQAQTVLDDLDKRQRRIVLLLGALGILTVAWLALWLWARGPSELVWEEEKP